MGFRASVHRHARRLNLTGFVKNNWDGTVKVVAQGPRATIEKFIEEVKESSFPASVSSVDKEWRSLGDPFHTFEIAP